MALNTQNTDAISFKKLSGKAHTQQNFAVSEEGISSNVQLSYSTVFGQSIDPLPVTNGGLSALDSTDGIVMRLKFEVDIIADTQIAAGRSQGYRLKLPSSFGSFSGGTYLHTSLGKLQVVPPLYGKLKADGSTEYDPILYQTNGSTVITKFNPINWYLDYYNGILFVQDPPVGYDVSASRPGYVEAYLYAGKFVENVLSGVTGTTNVTASNGLTMVGNDIQLGGILSGVTVLYQDATINGFGIISMVGPTSLILDNAAALNGETIYLGSAVTNRNTNVRVEEDRIYLGDTEDEIGGVTLIIDTTGNTINYNDDYSAYYGPRSIPDVAFVTGLTISGGSSPVNAANGLTKVGNTVRWGGTITGNTTILPNTAFSKSIDFGNTGLTFQNYRIHTGVPFADVQSKYHQGSASILLRVDPNLTQYSQLHVNGSTVSMGGGTHDSGVSHEILVNGDAINLISFDDAVSGVTDQFRLSPTGTTFWVKTGNTVAFVQSAGSKFVITGSTGFDFDWNATNKRLIAGNDCVASGGSINYTFGDSNINNGSFGSVMFGELSTIDTGVGAALAAGESVWIRAYGGKGFGRGTRINANGGFGFVGGAWITGPTNPKTNNKVPQVGGFGAFGFYNTDSSQTDNHGALGNYSAILGGANHNIPTGATSSAIIGGNTIKVSAGVSNTVHMPKIRFGLGTGAALTTNNSNNNFLVRNATTGEIEIRLASSISGGTGGSGSTVQNIYTSKRIVTGATTLTNDDFVIFCNGSSPFTLNVPPAPSDGQVYKIKDVSNNALTNNITISGNGKNIDGSSTTTINTNRGGLELCYDATLDAWFIMNFVG